MARGPLVDPEVRRKVARWVAEGERSPAAIYRALQRALDKEYEGKTGVQRPGLPTERTIGRLVKELTAQGSAEDSEPWSLATATPEEAAAVMPVLGAVLAKRAARLAWFPNDPPGFSSPAREYRAFSRGLARWVVRVAAAAPTLPPYEQYIVAREYRAAELSAARSIPRPYISDPKALDAFLACRPWERDNV